MFTCTCPSARGGVMHLTVSGVTSKILQGELASLTVVFPATKPFPVIKSGVPPAMLPDVGLMLACAMLVRVLYPVARPLLITTTCRTCSPAGRAPTKTLILLSETSMTSRRMLAADTIRSAESFPNPLPVITTVVAFPLTELGSISETYGMMDSTYSNLQSKLHEEEMEFT